MLLKIDDGDEIILDDAVLPAALLSEVKMPDMGIEGQLILLAFSDGLGGGPLDLRLPSILLGGASPVFLTFAPLLVGRMRTCIGMNGPIG